MKLSAESVELRTIQRPYIDAWKKPEIDHINYPKSLRRKTVAELKFIIADCQKALEIMPDNPKAGYYADEISYAAAELYRRSRSRKRCVQPDYSI